MSYRFLIIGSALFLATMVVLSFTEPAALSRKVIEIVFFPLAP